MNKIAITSGTTFVFAWITGLLVAGDGPKPTAGAAEVTAYFAAHQHAAMLEHFLIDAVAGAALIGVALTARRLSIVALTAGLAAAAVSVGQAAIGEAMVITASQGGSAATVHRLFTALNNADTIKIALVAVMITAVAAAARRHSNLPAWLVRASLSFAPALALSGLAFPLNNNALYSLLYLTLPLLLTWVSAFTIVVARRHPADLTRGVAVT